MNPSTEPQESMQEPLKQEPYWNDNSAQEAFYELGFMTAENNKKREIENYQKEAEILKSTIQNIEELNTINQDVIEKMGEMNDLVDAKLSQYRNIAVAGSVVGTVSLLAYLRERKVKRHLLQMVEEVALLSDDHDDKDIEELCMIIIDRLSIMPVRSVKNPFGVSRKESDHLTLLLTGIIRNVRVSESASV